MDFKNQSIQEDVWLKFRQECNYITMRKILLYISHILDIEDEWVSVVDRSPDPKDEPFLATDGQNIYTAFLTEKGTYIEQYTRAMILPTHWKLQKMPANKDQPVEPTMGDRPLRPDIPEHLKNIKH